MTPVVLKCNECSEVAVGLALNQAGTKCGRAFFRKGDEDGVVDRICTGTYQQALETFLICCQCFRLVLHGETGQKCDNPVPSRYGRPFKCHGVLVQRDWPTCRELVADGGRMVTVHMCGRTAKYCTKGGWYCKMHDPEQQQRRKEKRGPTRYEREESVRRSLEAWTDGMVKALRTLTSIEFCSCKHSPGHSSTCTINVALRALERS